MVVIDNEVGQRHQFLHDLCQLLTVVEYGYNPTL